MTTDTHAEFVGEALKPVAGAADAAGMSRGEPGLPKRFTWRGREYHVTRLLKTWKTSGPCRNGSSEVYLRRHWYTIETDPPATLTIYCDRQAKDRRKPKARWWVFTSLRR
jgi:phosphoribosylglycinamide formyltransferase-1